MAAPFGTFPLTLTGKRTPGALLRLQNVNGVVRCDPETPPGIGPAGVYEVIIGTPQTVWILNHNLGFRPGVRTYSAGGREMIGEVVHTGVNQALIYFDNPAAGFAVCT